MLADLDLQLTSMFCTVDDPLPKRPERPPDGATVVRPRREDEPEGGLHLAPLRQRIESIYWTRQGHPRP